MMCHAICTHLRANALLTASLSGILQYTTNKRRKLAAGSSAAASTNTGSGSTGGQGGSTNSTGGSGDGPGGTLGGVGDSVASASSSSNTSSGSHRLSGGLDFRGSGFGGLSHSNNHLFQAMTGGGASHADTPVQATPPLQRRLAKSFSVAQSSSLQKGHYDYKLILIFVL